MRMKEIELEMNSRGNMKNAKIIRKVRGHGRDRREQTDGDLERNGKQETRWTKRWELERGVDSGRNSQGKRDAEEKKDEGSSTQGLQTTICLSRLFPLALFLSLPLSPSPAHRCLSFALPRSTFCRFMATPLSWCYQSPFLVSPYYQSHILSDLLFFFVLPSLDHAPQSCASLYSLFSSRSLVQIRLTADR